MVALSVVTHSIPTIPSVEEVENYWTSLPPLVYNVEVLVGHLGECHGAREGQAEGGPCAKNGNGEGSTGRKNGIAAEPGRPARRLDSEGGECLQTAWAPIRLLYGTVHQCTV